MNSVLQPVTTMNKETDEGYEGPNGTIAPQLLRYWQSVLRWRWVILGIIAACIILGLLITLILPTLYTATAQIEIERDQKQITNVQGLDPGSNAEDLEFYATQYSLLVARPVLERVAARLDLLNNAEFFAAHGIDPEDAYEGKLGLTEVQRREQLQRMVIETLEDNVNIDPVRTSRLVDIEYTSRSAEISSAIANEWADAFIRVSMDRQVESTADARDILEERLAGLRERVEAAERDVIAYASEKDIVNLDRVRDDAGRSVETRTLAATNLEALNVELNQARSARIEAQSRLTENGGITSESVLSPTLAALRERKANLEADYARLMVNFEPNYPEAVSLRKQVETLNNAIEREQSRISASRGESFREALEREQRLAARVEEEKQRLDQQQLASIRYAVLQRERDTNRQLYDALLQRYKEIGVAGNVGVSNISVVEPAIVPEDPSFPSIPLNMAIALVLGMMLSAGTVIVLEHIDEGIREPAEVKPLLGLPLLGYTPLVKGEVLQELADTKSHYVESNFAIQANLSFATTRGFPASLTVASTGPNEGKSSLTFALATILGKLGRRVLLVDADMRSPSIHEFIDAANLKGFSNYLAGDDQWQAMVQQTRFKGLDVLLTGPIPPSAAQLLSGDRLRHFVESARAEYDHVIIDSPPVMGLTDGPILSRATEGCVFVIRANSTPLRGIRTAIDRLRETQVNVFGAVLTHYDEEQSGYGYGYGYGYGDKTATDSAEELSGPFA